ncbi:acyl-CoA thioesterase [Heyndrickxia faecalis]|uniref:acyl-CoA thioesterase n=1 Tax=Heyndrickxia faecalis TaxID=2824910 RepID=UPI003D1D0177
MSRSSSIDSFMTRILQDIESYSYWNGIVLSRLYGIEKAHHIAAAVTGNGLVKRRGCSSGSIMARTLQGCKSTATVMVFKQKGGIFLHELKLRTRFCETDAIGHINNTSYFIYLEDARLKFFESIGASVEIKDFNLKYS